MAVTVANERGADFSPILLESIQRETLLDFDLYLLKRAEGSGRFVLYRGRALEITEEHLKRLREGGIRTLFIKKGDRKNFSRYVEANLDAMLDNKTLGTSKKASFVCQAASGLVEDLLQNPGSEETTERASKLVETTVQGVLEEKDHIKGFLSVISHDPGTYNHSVNVFVYSLGLAKRAGLEGNVLSTLGMGAILHDLGKAKMQEEIFTKKAPLTSEEWKLIKRHPEIGVKMLDGNRSLSPAVRRVVAEHHEKCDGSGYPKGLKEDEIHPHAKLVCLVDIFEALTSHRAYRPGLSFFEALRKMRDEMAGYFDGEMWRHLVMMLGEAQ